MELILADWVSFAGTMEPAGKTMDPSALRDHAQEMLMAVVRDLQSAQTEAEQDQKSQGLGLRISDGDTGAESHGAGRAESGFTLQQMVAEFRALRASVLRLWSSQHPPSTPEDFDDVMRFNEAVDQALFESLIRFERELDQSREMLIAMLGHDLRTPLSAVLMTSQLMVGVGGVHGTIRDLAMRILRSAENMNELVDDLLDFTRTRVSTALPLSRQQVDLRTELAHAIDEMSAAKPQSVFELELELSGDLQGVWDASRLRQVLTNLLGNATQYGTANMPVQVRARGEATEIVLAVHNFGPTIAPANINGIFGPFKRLSSTGPSERGHLGLGLYIAERIVAAHGGSIAVTSSDEAGTCFVIHLPRLEPLPA